MANHDQALGRLLRHHRLAVGLTQEELADRAGISARTISDVERGIRTSIYRETALRLVTALALEEPEREQFEAIARGRRVRAEGSELPEWDRLGRAGLPDQPTRLIGREHELEIILRELWEPGVRLLTLTGPGGVGKTRLAVETASRLQTRFPGGVFFVPLASIRDPASVLPIVAQRLGLIAPQDPLVEALARRLSGERSLLVLDTFEHVLDSAPMIADLVATAPGLTVLVTSREILRLRAEREFAVPTLELPADDERLTLDVIDGCTALTLFVDRARGVKRDLVLDEEAAGIITEICRRVNGLPLAIELAAARVRHLPLRALLDHLEDRLGVLTGGARDLPPRQRTMRDTVRWSYDMLDPAEQALFRGLSVFAGGWAPAAAGSICAGGRDVLDGLSALVDKSLVTATDSTNDRPRYEMLDVVREFAAEQLAASADSESTARRHAEYFLSVAEAGVAEFGRAGRVTWFGALDEEHDNFHAALRYAIDRGDAELALRLAGALWPFWMSRASHAQGRMWLRQALDIDPQAEPPARAKALWGAAWLAFHQGDYDEMESLGEELLPLARRGDRVDMRNALTVRGMVAMARGKYTDALAHLQEALAICRRLEVSWLLATSLLNLGMASLHAGRPDDAQRLLEEAQRVYERLNDRRFAARTAQQLGYVALVQTRYEEARSLIAESQESHRKLGDVWGIAESLEGMSACEAAAGKSERAACIASAADALRERLATRPLPFDGTLTDRYLARAQKTIDETAWAEARARGRTMSVDEAVEYSLGGE